MTETLCAWCRRPVEVREGPGRPRRYCRRSCRQRAFEARRRALELGIGEDELIVARARLERLGDQLYGLRCAVEDVRRDLADADPPTAADYEAALSWLLEAADAVLAGERW